MTWNTIREHTLVYIALPELVVVENRKVPKFHVTAAPSSGGANHLTCRLSSARFSYIPASGGSGMQISPPDTVKKQPLGVVLRQGWRGGSRVSVHRQKTRQGFDRPMARWHPS